MFSIKELIMPVFSQESATQRLKCSAQSSLNCLLFLEVWGDRYWSVKRKVNTVWIAGCISLKTASKNISGMCALAERIHCTVGTSFILWDISCSQATRIPWVLAKQHGCTLLAGGRLNYCLAIYNVSESRWARLCIETHGAS